MTAAEPPREDIGRSVQDYIDERPVWADGTAVASTPMTAMQWRIWGSPPRANSSRAWSSS